MSEVQTAKRPTPASWRADGIRNETNTALSIRGVVFSRRLEHRTGIFAALIELLRVKRSNRGLKMAGGKDALLLRFVPSRHRPGWRYCLAET